jgi:hypothetical protein
MPTKIFQLNSIAGVKRDGTDLEGNYYSDVQHCRFQRGKPRKMGGYRKISDRFHGPSSSLYVSSTNGVNTITNGHPAGVEYVQVDGEGFGAGIVDRTPAAYVTNSNNRWQFDAMWDAAVGHVATYLIAHPGQNGAAIDSAVDLDVYAGDINASTALTAVGQQVSGGAVVLPPFLFVYGSDGYIAWSDENLPYTWTGGASGSARVTSSKIVKGLVYRGGPGNSPSGLFWSMDSLIRCSYVGGTAIFKFDTISDQSSVLSSSGIIEYDGMFFWAGVDRFLVYNGVVREVPNQMNLNYFFDNLNFAQRQKVWAMKVPRYGEIWWFYPSGSNTECDRAVILNVREQTWYDTDLARCSGHFAQAFRYPVMADPTSGTNGYSIWTHEVGWDEVDGSSIRAIQSYFQTANMGFPEEGPDQKQWIGADKQMIIKRVEPDFNQTGDMTLTVSGRDYPNEREPFVTTDFQFTNQTTKIDMKEQRRITTLRFTSNTLGGFYEMGQTLIHVDIGDGRQ